MGSHPDDRGSDLTHYLRTTGDFARPHADVGGATARYEWVLVVGCTNLYLPFVVVVDVPIVRNLRRPFIFSLTVWAVLQSLLSEVIRPFNVTECVPSITPNEIDRGLTPPGDVSVGVGVPPSGLHGAGVSYGC